MATIVLDKTAGIGPEDRPAPHRSRFGQLWDILVEAQEMRANVYLRGYLAHLSDAELAQRGMTRAQMIRRTRTLMGGL